jgi:hypothetical protein
MHEFVFAFAGKKKFVEALLSPHEQMPGRESLRAAYRQQHPHI